MHLYNSNIALYVSLFFFNDTATTEIYTLSLHDALPICGRDGQRHWGARGQCRAGRSDHGAGDPARLDRSDRSEEHTSELQSRLHLVCRLLLEKKKKIRHAILALDAVYRREVVLHA